MRTILWKLLASTFVLLLIAAMPAAVSAQTCDQGETEIQVFKNAAEQSEWPAGTNLRLKDKFDPAQADATVDCNDPWFTAAGYSGINPGAACGGSPFTIHYEGYLAYEDPETGICLDAGTWLEIIENMGRECTVCLELDNEQCTPDGDCDDGACDTYIMTTDWYRACVCRANLCSP